FRDLGRNALQSLVLYTQDEWKAKEAQVAQFTKEDGRKYAGRRLIDVPDPVGCHSNWVEHFWQDFGGVLDRFAPGVRIVTTTDTYRNPEMQALVRDLATQAEEVRAVVNKYRARHPYPPGWVPFEAFCEECGTIGATPTAVKIWATWARRISSALRRPSGWRSETPRSCGTPTPSTRSRGAWSSTYTAPTRTTTPSTARKTRSTRPTGKGMRTTRLGRTSSRTSRHRRKSSPSPSRTAMRRSCRRSVPNRVGSIGVW